MVVQHNLTAMNSNRMLGLTATAQAKSTEKLSSGYKINRAADDAAGLSISEKMRKQVRGLTQASLNAQDGISAVQTAEGALSEVHDMLQRMNELAVKASNGTMSENDRSYVQNEIDQLVTEIDRVSETTKFNETYLLKGSGKSASNAKVEATLGAAGAAKTVEATVTAAKGNITKGKFDMTATTKLAEGTEDKATITYIDDDGKTRTKDITFETGKDAKTTAANFADAINNDSTLSKVFKASVDDQDQFVIESRLDGDKTDDTKNKVTAVTFESATAPTPGVRLNKLTGTLTQEKATSSAYSVQVGKGDDSAAGGSASALTFSIADGNSITVNGQTYTYDEKKAGKNNVNSFQSLDDLQKLLGSDYTVTMKATATAVTTTYNNAAHTDKTVTENQVEQEILDSGRSKALTGTGALANTDFDANLFKATAAVATSATGSQTEYKDVKLELIIEAKASAQEASDSLELSLQVGADTTDENKISIDLESMSARSLGINGLRVDGPDSTNADAAVNTIASAIEKVSTQRSALGAVQNRLEHTIKNLDNVVENTTAAESQIRDTDMATEMVKYSNNNILTQAGQAMLAQANQSNQGVLSLLG